MKDFVENTFPLDEEKTIAGRSLWKMKKKNGLH